MSGGQFLFAWFKAPRPTLFPSRRPTPGNGYLEAIQQPNVNVYTKMLQRVTERGFIDAEGNEHEVDVFVCATCVSASTGLFDTHLHRVIVQWLRYLFPSTLSGHRARRQPPGQMESISNGRCGCCVLHRARATLIYPEQYMSIAVKGFPNVSPSVDSRMQKFLYRL